MIAHLISATAFALLAIAAAFTLARRDAALRFAILFVAVLRFAVPTQWFSQAGAGFASFLPERPRPIPAFNNLWLLVEPRPAFSHVAAAPATHAPAFGFPWLALWILGAVLCFALWILRRQRIPIASREPNDAEQSALLRARQGLGITQIAALRIAAGHHSPGAHGWLRPAIVLPDTLSAHLTDAELTAVLAHELAHVARRDNLLAAVSHAITCVFWFHPLLWWLERRMLLDREIACDERALSSGATPHDYAAGIFKICQYALAPSGYAAIGGSNLKQRMEHLMSHTISQSSRTAKAFTVAVLTAVAALIPATVGFLTAQPTALAQVLSPAPAAAPQTLEPVPPARPAPAVPPQPKVTADDYQQAVELLKAERYAEAQRAFRRAYENGDLRGLNGLVEAYNQDNQTLEALQLLQSEDAKAPDRLDIQVALGNTYVRAGKYDLALAQFEKVQKLLDPADKRNADIYLRIGETYRRMGNSPAAIEALRHALELMPDNLQALSTLALVLDGAGQGDEAAALYERILALDPNNGVVANNLAYLIASQGGDLDRALTLAQGAHELLPNLDEPADTLGYVYLKRNQFELAAAALAPVVYQHLENVKYRSHLVTALDQDGRSSDATERVKTALRQDPTPENQKELKAALEALPRFRALRQ